MMQRRQFIESAVLAALPGVATAMASPAALSTSSTTPLRTRPIPATGERLPVIGLGTWQTFDVGNEAANRAPLEAVMRAFVAHGGRMIDSSPMYGRAEDVAGELIEALKLRQKLFIATKVWTQGTETGMAQMRASLKKLRADPIDLMQVHNLVDFASHWPTLRAWKREQRVRYLGITHYTESAYDDVARVIEADKARAIDFLQINYSVAERVAEKRLLPLARERGIAVIANRPFAGGELIRRLREQPLPPLASALGASSWAQLLLKFVIANPAITCAIPATSKVDHLEDNMRAGRDDAASPLPTAAECEAIVRQVRAL